MREKRLPQMDADAGDEQEEPTKRPRTRFVELQPATDDPADAIDEEVPGSVRADVEPLVLGDAPFNHSRGGDPALIASHPAGDPGFARAQRAHLRRQQQDQGALKEALQAQESYDQPEEERNEAGDPIEPFHLRKEMEEGFFNPTGAYIEYERDDEQDAWLDSIEDQVHGTGPDRGRHLPYANEPVAEPPPLKGREVLPFLGRLLDVLQHGETVPAALRRLAGAGPVLAKFGSKEEARQFFEERVRSGHAVPAGNWEEFRALTEAAEVLFDAGQTDVYGLKREELAHRLSQAQAAQRAPPAAAPTARAAAEAAADLGTAGRDAAGRRSEEVPAGSIAQGTAGRLRRHHEPPPAAPAAAAEPAVAPDQPSVPSGERTAATTRGRAGVQAAAHGFAAQVPADVLAELPATLAPPQAMEAGLGLPTSAPTAQELQAGQQLDVGSTAGSCATMVDAARSSPTDQEHVLAQLQQQQAGASPEVQAAIQAALHGSFGERRAEEPAGQHVQGSEPAQQAQQAQEAPSSKASMAAAAVAFDNEAANLAGSAKAEE